jgi:predicted kinase
MVIKAKIYVVFGLSGAGKSTTSKILQDRIGGEVITSEGVVKNIFTTFDNSKDKDFTKEELVVGYNTMFLIAKYLLSNNINVILDGVFRSKKQRDRVESFAKELGVDVDFILVECEESVLKERIIKRFESKKQAGGFKNYLYLKKIFEPVSRKHFTVNSVNEIKSQIKKIIEK